MNFKKWVKSIQTAGYNGVRTVHTSLWPRRTIILFLMSLDQICPQWIKLDQIGFITNQ